MSSMPTITTNHGPERWNLSRGLSTTAMVVLLAGAFGATPMGASLAARENLNLSTPFEVSDSPAGNYLSAMVASADHDTVAAATFFREALRFDPRNPSLIERSFVAALANGNMIDAFTLGDRLVARDPGNGLAHLTLGIRALKGRQFAAARAELAKGGVSQQRDITATLLNAWSYAGSGNKSDDKGDPKAVERGKPLVDLMKRLGLDSSPQGRKQAASDLHYTGDPATVNGWLYDQLMAKYAGSDKLQSPDEKMALEACDRLRDENVAVFRDFHAGLIAELFGDTAEAGKRLRAAYAADKNTLRLVDAYGRYVSRHGDKAEALKVYQDFDAVLPNHPIIMSAIAALKAGKVLDPLIKTAEQGAAEVLYGLGAAGGRQGDEVAAMIYLRLALYLAPQNGLTLITLADIYDRLKQSEEAIAVYESVPETDVLRTTAEIQIGQLLDGLDKHDEAARYVAQIVAEHPNDEDALLALGNSERTQKKYTDAIGTYSKALAVSTKPEKLNWPLFYFRGIAYERAKMWPKAEADFRKGLALFPDQPLILNYLGYSWVDQGMNLDEAFQLLHKAVELRPSDGYVVDSLGWALYKLGKYDEAVKELERAIDLKPGDPTINDHLGDAYWRAGRHLEAHFQWNHARDLKPEPEDLPPILEKIAHGLPDAKPPVAADAKEKAPTEPATAPKSGG